jgi:uncharacterized protein (TIGR02145 family)
VEVHNCEGVPAKPVAIGGSPEVCAGTTEQTYSIAEVDGVDEKGYVWEFPDGWEIISDDGTTTEVTVTVGSLSGLIHVWATNKCGGGAAQTLAVAVPTAPVQPTVTAGFTGVCAVTTGLVYSVAKVEGVTYTWTVPNGWSISAGQGDNSITVSSGSYGGRITVTPTNACDVTGPQRQWTVTVMSAPTTPSKSGTWKTPACVGTSATYTVNSVTGATSYEWVVTGEGWEISGTPTGTSAMITAGTADGTIKVRAYNGCQYSATPMTQTIAVLGKPATPASITGNTSVCRLLEQTYTAAAVAGATGYVRELPDGWTITSATNGQTITATVGAWAGTGTISVKATNGCETSDAQTLTVNLNTKTPDAPGPITFSNLSTIEQYDTFTAEVKGESGTTYVWTLPDGLFVMGPSHIPYVTIVAGTAGTYNTSEIKVSAKYCVESTPTAGVSGSFTVTPFSLETSTVTWDGITYPTAKFGAAGRWMTENLRSTKTVQGSTTQTLPEYNGTDALTNTARYYYPDKSQAFFDAHPEYGLLYTWAAANIGVAVTDVTQPLNGRQGICPNEWHLPTKTEFQTLATVVSTKAGGYSSTMKVTPFLRTGMKLRSATRVVKSTHDYISDPGGTSHPDAFNALLVGDITTNDNYGFWTSDATDMATYATNVIFQMPYSSGETEQDITYAGYSKSYMYSIRCKKN